MLLVSGLDGVVGELRGRQPVVVSGSPMPWRRLPGIQQREFMQIFRWVRWAS